MKTFTKIIPAQLALDVSNNLAPDILETFACRFNRAVVASATAGRKQFCLNLGLESDDELELLRVRDLLITIAQEQGYKIEINDQYNITVDFTL